MYRYVFVFDLDETLVFVKDRDIYVRPYAQHILYSLWKNSEVYTVLWSAGDTSYVYNILSALNWHHYFVEVFTRRNCNVSYEMFGFNKCRKYVERSLSTFITMNNILRFVLIDDCASRNSDKNDYDKTIEPPPFYGENGDTGLYHCMKEFGFLLWYTGDILTHIKNAT